MQAQQDPPVEEVDNELGLEHLEGEPMEVVVAPVNTLRKVEQVRARILRGQQGELMRLKTYVSILGDNAEAVDKLIGKNGDDILAKVTDLILRELGHHEALAVDDTVTVSKTRREVQRRSVARGTRVGGEDVGGLVEGEE